VIMAGADTTWVSFSGFVKHMLHNPSALALMLREIDDATTSRKLSSPVPTSAEVSQYCPFYVACVKETMRLEPAVIGILPRLVSAGQPPLIIDGKVVPVGTEIGCAPWMVHRDKNIYGEDAEEFRPERWLEDEAKTKLFEKYFMDFGYGSRVCLGKDLAMMEMLKTPLMVSHPH